MAFVANIERLTLRLSCRLTLSSQLKISVALRLKNDPSRSRYHLRISERDPNGPPDGRWLQSRTRLCRGDLALGSC